MTAKPSNNNANRRKVIDTFELSNWLAELNLGVVPTVHVNGLAHPTAILTVDLGAPLNPTRLSPEQHQELTSRMRRLTKEMFRNDVNIRVSSDHQNGIYWASLS